MRFAMVLMMTLSIGACAQNGGKWGYVDGKAIPAEALDSCSTLRTAVTKAARDEAAQDLGVTVGQEDIGATAAHSAQRDPNVVAATIRQHAVVLSQALSAVYDKGMPADQAYHQIAAPGGISQQEWTVDLQTGSTPEGRAMLTAGANATGDQIAQAHQAGIQQAAAEFKLDAAVDKIIAASDPTYAADLARWNSSPFHPSTPQQRDYLNNTLGAWWQARLAKQSISLSDPTLVNTCQLSSIRGLEAVRNHR